MVKADISSCFPSIYTHSLAWALVSKETAKANQRNKNEWYNEIDSRTMGIKHNETHGLLIGPHASNLLSEIILTSVDRQLNKWDYTRHIDDYTCFVETYEEGQLFLTNLTAALRTFDLSLNHKKTEICELPLATVKHWKRKLNSFHLMTGYGKVDYKHVCSFLDLTIELMKDNRGDAGILKYAIKMLSNQDLTPNAREYCSRTIINLSLMYPYLVSLLDEYVFQMHCVHCDQDFSCISEYSNMAYKKGRQLRNHEQIAYSLFFAIKYKFIIDDFKVQDAIDSGDCIFLLLAYLYTVEYTHLDADKKALKSHAKTLCMDKESMDQFWLFIYEVLPKTDLTSGEWKALKGANVTFIKPTADW